jgi:hypothetical protein
MKGTKTPAPAPPAFRTCLRDEDCDRIDLAKGRILRLNELIAVIVDHEDAFEALDRDFAVLVDLCDIIREDVTMITAVLETAQHSTEKGGVK